MAQTILVADDNPTMQRVASSMLSGQGLDVVTVANGVAAIKKITEALPVLVVADADMPGKDGYEVCEFVKNHPDLRHVHVLIAVTDADLYDTARGHEVRADGVIKKPFRQEDLASALALCTTQAEERATGPQAQLRGAPVLEVPFAFSELASELPELMKSETALREAAATDQIISGEPAYQIDDSTLTDASLDLGMITIPTNNASELAAMDCPTGLSTQSQVQPDEISLAVPEGEILVSDDPAPPLFAAAETAFLSSGDPAQPPQPVIGRLDAVEPAPLTEEEKTGRRGQEREELSLQDLSLIAQAVQKTVRKLAPSVLSPTMLRELEQILICEVIEELTSTQ